MSCDKDLLLPRAAISNGEDDFTWVGGGGAIRTGISCPFASLGAPAGPINREGSSVCIDVIMPCNIFNSFLIINSCEELDLTEEKGNKGIDFADGYDMKHGSVY